MWILTTWLLGNMADQQHGFPKWLPDEFTVNQNLPPKELGAWNCSVGLFDLD